MRAFAFATAEPWAILPSSLHDILAIAARENDSIEAVEKRLGRKLDNTRTVTMRGNGVALIPIAGPIFPHANLFTEVSGATSIDTLAKEFEAAISDPTVRAIILNIDSPGGQVDGVHEFAEMVYAARGRKPIAGYIGGTGASGAIWIGSAVDPGRLIVDRTAKAGSIGVLATVPDPTKRARNLEFVSSVSPRKREDPTTEAGKSSIQTMVDAIAEVFVEDVARNRGVTVDDVVKKFGAGGIQVGRAAVESGLVDGLGSLEQLIETLSATSPNRLSIAATARPQTTAKGKNAMEVNQENFDKLQKDLAASRARERASSEKAITADVGALITGLRGKSNVRFTRDELATLESLLVTVRTAALSESDEVRALASTVDAGLATLIKSKAAVAPTTMLPIRDNDTPPNDVASDGLTPADFTSAALNAATSQKIDRVLTKRKVKDSAMTFDKLRAEVLARGTV